MSQGEFNAMPGARRVVLVTLGSWGDVLPYVATYREKVHALGVGFRAVGRTRIGSPAPRAWVLIYKSLPGNMIDGAKARAAHGRNDHLGPGRRS